MTEPLVQARQLTKHYVLRGGLFSRRQVVRALHWVDLTVYPGETFGVVGESGCGKTTLGRCLLRLVEPTFGEVLFRGENLLQLDRETLRQRRRYFQMLFQNPYLSLDPRMNVPQPGGGAAGDPYRPAGARAGGAGGGHSWSGWASRRTICTGIPTSSPVDSCSASPSRGHWR
jgi:ABC-type phosphonate transport system ATPase subunit